MDTLKTKQELEGAFTDEQAEALVAILRQLVTQNELRDEMRRWTLRIILGNAAVVAALLALFAFAS